MAATKEDIVKALIQLDSGNDQHWTDDGLPRVDVVQTILKDPDVRRKDINDAQPGFSRAVPGATTEPEDIQPGDEENAALFSSEPEENADDILGDETIDDEALKELMKRRVSDAEQRMVRSREATQEARNYERKCEMWHVKALSDLNRRFPPLHPSDAIKQHLESQLRQRYERAGFGASQIDNAMGTRGRRGWGQSARRIAN
jgi:hypothetical protein